MSRPCSNCSWLPAIRAGRCNACSQYFFRHKKERPEELIVRHAQKIQERLVLGRLVRQIRAAS